MAISGISSLTSYDHAKTDAPETFKSDACRDLELMIAPLVDAGLSIDLGHDFDQWDGSPNTIEATLTLALGTSGLEYDTVVELFAVLSRLAERSPKCRDLIRSFSQLAVDTL